MSNNLLYTEDMGDGTLATVFQHIGERSEQQDSFLIIKNPPPLTETDVEKTFAELNTHMETAFGPMAERGGTTASVAIIRPDLKITTANVGDSRVTLFVHKMKDDIVNCFPLTKDDNGDDPEEKARLEALGHKIEGKRLIISESKNLGMTAAIGNSRFNPYVRHTPRIQTFDLTAPEYGIEEGDEIIICVESDGMHMSQDPLDRSSTVENISFQNMLRGEEGDGTILPMQMINQFAQVAKRNKARREKEMLADLSPNAKARLEKIMGGDDNDPYFDTDLDELEGEARTEYEEITGALLFLNDNKLDNMTFLCTKIKAGGPGHILAVFDGHGRAGAIMSEEARDRLREKLSPVQG
jgi:serine/threonine protein phosphatase PrpC